MVVTIVKFKKDRPSQVNNNMEAKIKSYPIEIAQLFIRQTGENLHEMTLAQLLRISAADGGEMLIAVPLEDKVEKVEKEVAAYAQSRIQREGLEGGQIAQLYDRLVNARNYQANLKISSFRATQGKPVKFLRAPNPSLDKHREAKGYAEELILIKGLEEAVYEEKWRMAGNLQESIEQLLNDPSSADSPRAHEIEMNVHEISMFVQKYVEQGIPAVAAYEPAFEDREVSLAYELRKRMFSADGLKKVLMNNVKKQSAVSAYFVEKIVKYVEEEYQESERKKE